MSAEAPSEHPPRFDAAQWCDASSRESLQLIAASVAQMVGFEVAVISAVQGDHLVSVAIEGNDDVRATLDGMLTPMSTIHQDLAVADDWGRFKFVPHERAVADDGFRWVPDIEPGTEADSWHPLDALLAPLYDADGEVRGLLSIDLPISGRRPDEAQLGLLERYATQAERAVLNAIERDALAQRLRLAEVARQVVRFAVAQTDIEAALDECRPSLLEGYRADDLTIRTYPDDSDDSDDGGDGGDSGGTPSIAVTDRVRELVRTLAHTCWDQQRAGVLTDQWFDSTLIGDAAARTLSKVVVGLGYTSAMIVPIGVGQRCLGHVILFRTDSLVPWTRDERDGALDVARDIGHAVLASRNLAREQRLVSELRELDSYKTQLLSTVSHELKNPLGAIAGHLELVSATPDLSEDTQFSVSAMARATARVSRVVDDLLILAQLEDPDTREPAQALDLRPALTSALESARFAAERRQLVLDLDAPDGPLPVCGDEEGLERVFSNLVGNAAKYTPRSGTVRLAVRYLDDEVEISVADQGIGISAEDQKRLFTEFFRSTNPVALAEPGTGLGLAISSRIVSGHGGRIEVDSTLGEGSTFRVYLPVPGP